MGDINALSGILLPGAPVIGGEAAHKDYVDSRSRGTLGDDYVYGDSFSTMRRQDAGTTNSSPLVTGIIKLLAGVAASSFTATKLRLYPVIAAAGTGTFNAAVYTGSDSAALTRRATIPQSTSLSTGLIEFTLSTGVAITPELHVVIALLSQSFSTHPSFARQSGGPPSALINANSTRRIAADGTATQTSLPASINMGSGFSGAGIMWWAALAP